MNWPDRTSIPDACEHRKETWWRRHRAGAAQWKLLLFIVGVASLTLTLIFRPFIRSRLVEQNARIVSQAEQALDVGDLAQAVELAHTAVHRARFLSQPVAPALLIMGLARERQAQLALPAQRLIYLSAATQHLTEALSLGIPDDELPRLRFHLGRCLHARGQYPESIYLLRQSLGAYPSGRVEALKLLTSAYLDPSRRQVEQALMAVLDLLEIPELAAEDLIWGWTTRGTLYGELDRTDLLAGLDPPPQAGGATLVGPLVKACEAFEAREFQRALATFRELAKREGLPREYQGRLWFLVSIAASEAGQTELAVESYGRLVQQFPELAEAGEAAALAAALLLQSDRTGEALVLLRQAVQLAGTKPPVGKAPVTGPALSKLIQAAMHTLRDHGQFEQAEALLEAHRFVSDAVSSDQLAVEFYELWGKAKLLEASTLDVEAAAQAVYDAEQFYRKAGSIARRLADAATPSDAALPLLWRAANNLMSGRGFLEAQNALELLLTAGASGDLRAQALALMCSALDNSGKHEQVYEVAETCIREFPDHPATCTAYFHLGRCQIGFGELDGAEASLRAVLDATPTDAGPEIQQQARLLFAHLMFDQGREDEAIPRINELLADPISSEQSQEGRLLLAECLRRQAQRPAARVMEVQSDQAKSHYQQMQENSLNQSLRLFSTLQRELAALDRAGQLDDTRHSWLRQCRWGMADCLYEANRVAEAAELYKLLAESYSEPSDWLVAQLQIANCNVRMNRMDEALAVVRQAQIRLKELPTVDREQARLGMRPERWREWLDWVGRM